MTEATGSAIGHSGIAFHRIACGMIAEQWVSNDEIGLLKQIGAIPTPPGQESGNQPETTAPLASPAADCAATTAEENTAIVQRLLDGLNARDLSIVDELHAETHLFHGEHRAPSPASDDTIEAIYAEWLGDYPDRRAATELMIASGDRVAVRVNVTGTMMGDFEQTGIAGTGQAVSFATNTIYRVACGEIAETWMNWDGLAVHRQLQASAAATPTA